MSGLELEPLEDPDQLFQKLQITAAKTKIARVDLTKIALEIRTMKCHNCALRIPDNRGACFFQAHCYFARIDFWGWYK